MNVPNLVRSFFLLQSLVTASAALAQDSVTVPAACETLPGNAAVSMPLRWTEGKLQVFVDPPLLPPSLVGETLTGVRLRRSVLPGMVACGALSRTLTVRGAFQTPAAAQVHAGYAANRPPGTQVLFGPAVVSAPATPAPGPATTVGDDVVVVTFTTPLPVTPGTLFLEFEAGDPTFTIEPDQWVDAVWFDGGADDGYVVPVGDGSCTTRGVPTELVWTSADGPVSNTSVTFELRGAPAGAPVLVWVGLDPENTPAGPGFVGYGASLGFADPAMAACHVWAPLDVTWSGIADGTGRFATSLDIPGAAVVGTRLGLQGGWFDPSRPVLPLSLSQGLQLVCNSAGVQDRCNTMMFPADAAVSPWGPLIGLMPVLQLDY